MWNQDGYTTDFYDADSFERFPFGHPPSTSADWAWVQHMLASLSGKGRAVVVLDTGAVARGSGAKSQNKERLIRQRCIEEDLIEAVILLPENLFYNTPAPGILLCLNKAKPASRRGTILLINASGEFIKGRPKNYVPDSGADKVVAAFESGEDVDEFARVITLEEATENDFNISPERYVTKAHKETVVPLADAVSQLREVEAERRIAINALEEMLDEALSVEEAP